MSKAYANTSIEVKYKFKSIDVVEPKEKPEVISGTSRYFQILSCNFRYFHVLLGTSRYFQVLIGTFWYFQILSGTFWYFLVLWYFGEREREKFNKSKVVLQYMYNNAKYRCL